MMIDIETVRSNFPYLDDVLYLNTASAGLTHGGVGRASAIYYDRIQSRGYDGREDWRAVAGRVQAMLARLMNVGADDIGFTGSTTEALNLLARALPVGSGDRIVFMDDEFPSLRAALEPLAREGADILPLSCKDEARRTDVLCGASQGAKIVGISHVHWCTGTRVDLTRLGKQCRAEGAILLVDGVQALGATPVDASNADAYAASTFKWLLGGFGLGIVVVRESLRKRLKPAFRGYFNPWPSTDIRYGHINYPGLCALEGSLLYLEALGWDNIFQRVETLRNRLADKLIGMGADVVTPHDSAGILSVRTRETEALVARLHDRGVRVEARNGLLRISPHFYNRETEIDRFCEILAATSQRASQ